MKKISFHFKWCKKYIKYYNVGKIIVIKNNGFNKNKKGNRCIVIYLTGMYPESSVFFIWKIFFSF